MRGYRPSRRRWSVFISIDITILSSQLSGGEFEAASPVVGNTYCRPWSFTDVQGRIGQDGDLSLCHHLPVFCNGRIMSEQLEQSPAGPARFLREFLYVGVGVWMTQN